MLKVSMLSYYDSKWICSSSFLLIPRCRQQDMVKWRPPTAQEVHYPGGNAGTGVVVLAHLWTRCIWWRKAPLRFPCCERSAAPHTAEPLLRHQPQSRYASGCPWDTLHPVTWLHNYTFTQLPIIQFTRHIRWMVTRLHPFCVTFTYCYWELTG